MRFLASVLKKSDPFRQNVAPVRKTNARNPFSCRRSLELTGITCFLRPVFMKRPQELRFGVPFPENGTPFSRNCGSFVGMAASPLGLDARPASKYRRIEGSCSGWSEGSVRFGDDKHVVEMDQMPSCPRSPKDFSYNSSI
jgi:hypothetical protein